MKKFLLLLLIFAFAFNFAACSDDDSNPPALNVVTGEYSIQGQVTINSSPLDSVTITLGGASNGTTSTDASGSYTFSNLKNGDYILTPTLTGYTFDPASISVTINNADAADKDFAAIANAGTYSIQGNTTVPNVTVALTGGLTSSTISDALGNYTFIDLENGDYTITPSLTGYIFNPASIAVTINNADATAKDFAATPLYSIQGNTIVPNVTVALTGDLTSSTISDANGNYTFTDLENGNYTITPSLSGYSFNPASISVTINNANVTGQNFTAIKASGAFAYLHYTLPDQKHFLDNYPGTTIDDEAAILFSNYTLTTGILYDSTPSYVDGYALDQFVDKATVNAVTPDHDNKLGTSDARTLYSYVVVSNNDGFDSRANLNRTSKLQYNPDTSWAQFIQGYLLNLHYDGRNFFPSAVGLGNVYNIKYSYDIYLFRKIDVKRPDTTGTAASFEIGATTTRFYKHSVYTANTGKGMTKFTLETINFYSNSITDTAARAIKLEQFITTYIVSDPANTNYSYKIVAVDGFSRSGWSWDKILYTDGSDTDEIAYYLVDYDIICRVKWSTANSRFEQVNSTKINFPVRIEVVTTDAAAIAAADAYTYTTYDAPAYAIYKDSDNGYTAK